MTEMPMSMETLQARKIGLWQASLALSEDRLEQLASLLSEEETARAARFLSEVHRRRFVAAHGILRCILGRLLDISPGRLVFEADDQGKPRLKNDLDFPFFCFNLSHSHERMLLGVCPEGPIGVDVEYVRARVDVKALADRFFFPAEARAVQNGPQDLARKRFYQYWTLKEAYLKATGEGIARLQDIEIQIPENGRCRVLDRGHAVHDKWTILPVPTSLGYAGALAAKTRGPDFEMPRMLPFEFSL